MGHNLVSLLLLLPFLLDAQTQRWVFRYNGSGNNNDYANAVAYGSNGNVYAAGSVRRTNDDFTVISLTQAGDTNWVFVYNGPGNGNDYGTAIAYGTDGNIYAAGYTRGAGTGDDFTVISLKPSGDTNWVRRYNGPGNGNDRAAAIIYGANNNIYAAGYSHDRNDDFTVISYRQNGDTNWVRRINGPGNNNDYALDLVYGGDGRIYVAGTIRAANEDFSVVSFTQAGDTNWVRSINGPGNNNDRALAITYGADSHIYAAGYIRATNDNFAVVRFTQTGDTSWVRAINGSGNNIDHANDIIYGADNRIYAAGYIRAANDNFAVVSYTQAGDTNWIFTYNGPGNNIDQANSIVYGTDGNIYAAGFIRGVGTGEDFAVFSLRQTGDTNWVYRYNSAGNNNDRASAVAWGSGDNLYAAGYAGGGNDDFLVISLRTTGIAEENLTSKTSAKLISCATLLDDAIKIRFAHSIRNPIKIVLYNVYGTAVYEREYSSGCSSLTVRERKIHNLASGVYYLCVVSENKNLGILKLIKL